MSNITNFCIYFCRRYRKKYENTDKIKELMIEQFSVVENLKTAIEGKMEIAVIGTSVYNT